jgi:nitroreductase
LSDQRGTDFFDVVHRQRACRSFTDEPVDDEALARILDAATFAPSAENRQPWVFVVVRDPELRSGIHDLTERAWAGGGRDFAATRLDEMLLREVDRGVAGGGYRGAPVVIVVCADTDLCLEATIASSIFPATQNLLLAATALGLGSALTTLTTAFTSELAALLALPPSVVPQVVVPVGHPERPPGPPRRQPFAERTSRERYGTPWSRVTTPPG